MDFINTPKATVSRGLGVSGHFLKIPERGDRLGMFLTGGFRRSSGGFRKQFVATYAVDGEDFSPDEDQQRPQLSG